MGVDGILYALSRRILNNNINIEENKSIKIYPNPVSDKIVCFEPENIKILRTRVFDHSGKTMDIDFDN